MTMNNNKYQRMPEIHNIIGFVVNVHDPTNFDIDFEISDELHEKYKYVISNKYTYQDINLPGINSNDISDINVMRNSLENNDTPKIGITYRCRLRGIGINQLTPHIHTWKRNQLCVEIKQLIDRTDGWIICTLSDIDIYRRLLVDVIINTRNGSINLCDYLLTRMSREDNPIFSPYKTRS